MTAYKGTQWPTLIML